MKRVVAVVVASLAILAATLVPGRARARPGGGQSFSRSSSSSSSSGSSRSSYSSSSSSSSSGGRSTWSTSSSSSSSSGSTRSTWSTSSSSSSSSSGFTSTSASGGSSGYSGYTTSSSGYTSTSSSGGSGYVPPPVYSDPTPTSYGPPPDPSFGSKFLFAILACVALLAAVIAYASYRKAKLLHEWEARADAVEVERERARRWSSIDAALAAVRSADDAFSFVLFEDFLYALYAEVHTARGAHTLERLATYLGTGARATLAEHPADAVEAIVVGGMRVDAITTEASNVRVEVVFMANMTEASRAYYMEERWTLVRGASAQSREPGEARVIGCPSCGAPLDKTIGAKCGYCGVASSHGNTDWFVERIEVLARDQRGPMLTGTTEEVGTDLPTVIAPDAKKELAALRARDPSFTWPGFVARVEKVFAAFHAAWSARDLTGVRPYLSDNLFDVERYWVDAYEKQGLRNLTDGAHVVTVQMARVTHDKYFEAITVRVYASCHDYTLDERGQVVGGDKTKARDYTEYWTFVRAAKRAAGQARADGCPSCGAPIDGINMAGTCGSCHAKVTTGDFDWVLSRIEQDEVYEVAA